MKNVLVHAVGPHGRFYMRIRKGSKVSGVLRRLQAQDKVAFIDGMEVRPSRVLQPGEEIWLTNPVRAGASRIAKRREG